MPNAMGTVFVGMPICTVSSIQPENPTKYEPRDVRDVSGLPPTEKRQEIILILLLILIYLNII